MHQSSKLFFPKRTFSYCLFFLMSVFLVACERVSNSNTTPVFTISAIPMFKQNEPSIATRLQPDNQSREFTASQPDNQSREFTASQNFLNDSLKIDNQSKTNSVSGEANTELIQTPDHSELTSFDALDLASIDIPSTSPRGKTFVENNLNKLKETKNDNQNNEKPDSAKPGIKEEREKNIEEATALENFKAKQERDKKDISDTEHTTSTEIASVINVPKANQKQPQIERIKLNAFIDYNLQKLEKIMGKPNFILRDDELRLWQYQAGECIIDFFFKLKLNEYSVSFIDIRASRLGDKMDTYTCEKELTDALNS